MVLKLTNQPFGLFRVLNVKNAKWKSLQGKYGDGNVVSAVVMQNRGSLLLYRFRFV